MSKLYVIAGHGAGDPGAQGNGYGEAERVRELAKRMKKFGGNDVEVLDMNRNWFADGGISSLNIPKGSEILELHLDSGGAGARGGHVLDKPGIGFDKYDRAVASFISSFFPGRAESLREQSLGNASRAYNKGYGYRLVENGFITDKGDITKFNNQMDELAKGLLQCFGITGQNTSTSNTNQEVDEVINITIPKGTYPVYRAYNEKSGGHLFTSNQAEYDGLGKGWKKEGISWQAADTGAIVYRMYNPNNSQHMFTLSFNEAKALQVAGWKAEGSNFASAREGIPVFRLYNPNNGDHFFTTDSNEKDTLVKVGWKDEGIAFNAVK